MLDILVREVERSVRRVSLVSEADAMAGRRRVDVVVAMAEERNDRLLDFDCSSALRLRAVDVDVDVEVGCTD